jgi:bifunctional DNA-binding transcriptional regulator/antitoxin component of YhaV-PrlF toxin-antitoxin module
MVKLQKRFAYKYKDKEHYKHVVIIPEELVEKLGWKTGEELKQIVQEEKLIVEPLNNRKIKSLTGKHQ